MSSHSWSGMHLNHTLCTLLIVFLFEWLVFFIVVDTCGIREMWLNGVIVQLSFLSNLILHWVTFELLLFLLERKRCVQYPCISRLFIQFSRLIEMNQLESWVYLQISSGFCKFCVCKSLFWTAQSSTYTSALWLVVVVVVVFFFFAFKPQYCHCFLANLFSYLYFLVCLHF